MKVIKNPFYIYILIFITIFSIYSLRWSELYPSLEYGLLFFFTVTFIISYFLGLGFSKMRNFDFIKLSFSKIDIVVIIGILIAFILEFLYAGYVPIFKYLSMDEFKFKHFGGIPTFHVLLVSFTTFYSTYTFHKLISNFSFAVLVLFILSVVPSILMFNRGMFFTIFFSSFFIFIYSFKRISWKVTIVSSVFVLYILYLFGVSSNYRTYQINDNKAILQVSIASDEFKDSFIPKEYMWANMYICSPLGNLQNIINVSEPKDNIFIFFQNNIIPDFIQNRINPLLDNKKEKPPLVTPFFNVSTFYGKSYYNYGYVGMFIIFIFQAMMIYFSMLVLRQGSKYQVANIAILNGIVILNSFSNIMIFSGITLQVFWIIVLGTLEKLNTKIKFV